MAGGAALAFARERPPLTTARYSERVFDQARMRGDPLGDAALASVLQSGKGHARPASVARELAASGDPACRALLDQMTSVPRWVDFETMRPGAEAGLRHVMTSGFALLCGSLVESYAGQDGAHMLMRIGRLQRDVYRRVVETLQFVSDVGLERGPRPGSRAFDEALGVRLMHSWARHIVQRNGGWDTAQWGQPINQEELAHTVTLFSHVYRRSLELLGLEVTPDEHESTHHSWRYVGYLLGAEEAILPASQREEENLYLWTTHRGYGASSDGISLTKALFAGMSRRPPFMMPEAGLASIARHLVGAGVADEMGIVDSKLGVSAVRAAVELQRAGFGRLRWGRAARTRVGELFVGAILRSALASSGTLRRTHYGIGAARGP